MRTAPVAIETINTRVLEALGRSNGLWRIIYRSISHVMTTAIRERWSREKLADTLDEKAGPCRHEEPVSIGAFRTVAEAVRTGTDVSLL